jgi:hypothetical protein
MGGFLLLYDPLDTIFTDDHAPAWCKLCDYAFIAIIAFAV